MVPFLGSCRQLLVSRYLEWRFADSRGGEPAQVQILILRLHFFKAPENSINIRKCDIQSPWNILYSSKFMIDFKEMYERVGWSSRDRIFLATETQ
jgi:hypothetical protein